LRPTGFEDLPGNGPQRSKGAEPNRPNRCPWTRLRRAADTGSLTPTRLIIRRIHELRRGRSETFRRRVRLPQTADARYCFSAVALADSARLARARPCARVVPR
jgi:hypothetical protein